MSKRDKKKVNKARYAKAKTARDAAAARSETGAKKQHVVVTSDGRVIECDDPLAVVQEQTRLADAEVRPWQAKLVPGDYFFKVVGDLPIFGEILEIYEEPHVRHFRFTRCFSTDCPDGELGDIHVADVCDKLTFREFDRTRRVGWTMFLSDVFADVLDEDFRIDEEMMFAMLAEIGQIQDFSNDAMATIACRCRVHVSKVSRVLDLLECFGRHIVRFHDADVRFVVRYGHNSSRWMLHGYATYGDMAEAITTVYCEVGADAVAEVYLLDVATGKAMALSAAADLDRGLWGPASVFGMARFEMRTVFPQWLFDAVSAHAEWD